MVSLRPSPQVCDKISYYLVVALIIQSRLLVAYEYIFHRLQASCLELLRPPQGDRMYRKRLEVVALRWSFKGVLIYMYLSYLSIHPPSITILRWFPGTRHQRITLITWITWWRMWVTFYSHSAYIQITFLSCQGSAQNLTFTQWMVILEAFKIWSVNTKLKVSQHPFIT